MRLSTKEGRIYHLDSIVFFPGTPVGFAGNTMDATDFPFLTALDSAEGNWNTIMTSTVTPSSPGL